MIKNSVFKFINHASILIEFGKYSLLTDPWYASNAFGSWYQKPAPRKDDVLELIDSDQQIGVLVSHGHDDHLDEWFISHHLKNSKFFVPTFPTGGLLKRLKNKVGVDTSSIGDKAEFGPFTLRQFINDGYTSHDAIVTIEFDSKLIIHANDNWHKWPEIMIQRLVHLKSGYAEKDVFYLAQFGIADCFPMNYPQIQKDEAHEIVFNRFVTYKHAIGENLRRLGLDNCYVYANQSNFDYENLKTFSNYEEVQKIFLTDERFIQLIPGDLVNHDQSITRTGKSDPDFFDFRLKALEDFINSRYQIKESSEYIPLVLRTTSVKKPVNNNAITYEASVATWNLILTGELTLESIIIGGSGLVYKPQRNIREHFIFISKLSYEIQNRIKDDGINFFRTKS